ncbi:hypothetical protein ILUMI_09181 [Ignelater luminosus]|uniref:Uncharacterized protein n=1 Tax=Ignelater luminosus TaxID=2038154 RepID=A0A8K0D0H1_IGNLU|nr:hypothetical protein ILUMI_09181 [Ignelater luminosus]
MEPAVPLYEPRPVEESVDQPEPDPYEDSGDSSYTSAADAIGSSSIESDNSNEDRLRKKMTTQEQEQQIWMNGVIEAEMRKHDIKVQSEWDELIKSARTNPSPFNVVNATQDIFFNMSEALAPYFMKKAKLSMKLETVTA